MMDLETTRAEEQAIFEALTDELKAPALKMLREHFECACPEEEKPIFLEALKGGLLTLPLRWHFSGGMSIRNRLRDARFGEKYFGVENLDFIYLQLLQEALGVTDES